MMRILRTWKCDVGREIQKLKRHIGIFDDVSTQKTTVQDVIRDVQRRGDKAVAAYSKRFDKVSLSPEEFRINNREIDNAYRKVSRPFIKSIQRAIANIRAYQEHIRIRPVRPLKMNGVVLDTLYSPLESAGIYVPGGAASYPSTVLMNAVPAQVAGVNTIVMVTPPAKDGSVPPERLVAAREAGITEIYKVGGAQAIAALAYGTGSIPKVDKVVGPGNIFVTLAKKEIFGHTGIDMMAGPSEVLIIADDRANPAYVASDLLSQAEHAPGISVLATFSETLVDQVTAELKRQITQLKRYVEAKRCLDAYGAVFLAKNLDECVEISNTIAPEHLQIMTRRPRVVLKDIKHAGAIFLGSFTPVAVGDYLAGPSHVLPTSGTARFSSGLSVNDFLKRSSVITYTRPALKDAYPDIAEISESEGLDAHTRSVRIRVEA